MSITAQLCDILDELSKCGYRFSAGYGKKRLLRTDVDGVATSGTVSALSLARQFLLRPSLGWPLAVLMSRLAFVEGHKRRGIPLPLPQGTALQG
jgi:hypothetical protein